MRTINNIIKIIGTVLLCMVSFYFGYAVVAQFLIDCTKFYINLIF